MEEEEDCIMLCSFALTGSNLAHQAIYICNTCNSTSQDDDDGDNKCCCESCAKICHDGHDVEFLAFGRGFCDCGELQCNLCLSSYDHAKKCLIKKKNLALDEEGRVEDDTIRNIQIDPIKISTFQGLTNENLGQSLRMHCIALSKLSKDTFWIGGNSSPRSPLEVLALKIFYHHIEDLNSPIDMERSGAEYWVQVKGVESSSDNGNEIDSKNLGVDIHYDKDEEIASIFKVGVFPTLSTVTYLSEVAGSAPTVVFQTTANAPVGSPITKLWISDCNVNKHLCFDGRYLHGAPSQLMQKGIPLDNNATVFSGTLFSNLRVTFLVNIWLHHQPSSVLPMPNEIIESIAKSTLPISNTSLASVFLQPVLNQAINEIQISTDDIDDDNGNWEVIPFVSDKTAWGKGVDEAGISLRMWLPNILQSKQYIGTIGSSSTTQVNYNDTECAALLEYEEDPDDFLDEVNEMNVDDDDVDNDDDSDT